MFLINSFRYAAAGGATTTWNPAGKSSFVVLSNGNLTATNPDTINQGYARATTSQTTGSYHFEVTQVSQSGTADIRDFGVVAVGTGDSISGVIVRGVGQIASDGSDVAALNGGALTNGNTVAVEVNAATGEVWVQRSGQARQGPFTSASFPSSAMQPIVRQSRTSGTSTSHTANFGQSTFAVTPTSGFVAWG